MTAKKGKTPSGAVAQKALLRCLREVKEVNLEPGFFGTPGSGERSMQWFKFSKGGAEITGDTVDAFFDVMATLEQDRRIGYEFSAKTIEQRVKDFLLNAVLGDAGFDRVEVGQDTAWGALLAGFKEKHDDASYFVPIANLELSDTEELTIGAVKIHASSSAVRDKITASLTEIIRGNRRYTEDQQEQQLRLILSQTEFPPECCIAEIRLRVHPDRGHELAVAAARESVAILRLVAPLVQRSGVAAVPALLGEVAQAARMQISLGPGQRFNFQGGFVGIGPVVPLRLTPKTIEYLHRELKALGAAVATALPRRSDMQNRISTALRWYSDAIVEPEVTGRFLKFCVALEALLLDRETDAIGSNLAQSVAVLLADDADTRLTNDGSMKEIYRVRSRIAHEGKDMRARRLMDTAQVMAAASIARVAHLSHEEHVTSAGDLSKWVKERLYG